MVGRPRDDGEKTDCDERVSIHAPGIGAWIGLVEELLIDATDIFLGQAGAVRNVFQSPPCNVAARVIEQLRKTGRKLISRDLERNI